jgi:hypothetical protein
VDHRSFSNLVLHRIDAACNMAHTISIEPTLLGGEALVRNWAGSAREVGTAWTFSSTRRRPRGLWRVWPGSSAAEAMFQCLTGGGLKSAGKE